MSKSRIAFALALLFAAAAAQAVEVAVPRPVPLSEDNEIAGNIKRECELGDKLAHYIAEFGRAGGQEVRFVASDASPGDGRFLEVEIRDAMSTGNAFVGHRKSVSVRGKLHDDGRVIGSFRARRDSMGGAFGGYKGSCSVLGRTVKALGKDIVDWMAAPRMDADLGDLK
ncbi:MAG TPA: hypothetical protein VND91_08330 [Candidatus Saccharimonadia bacterium]|nr:hypothetical protein [Candidatus Saccharimonadia bacterium]